MNIASVASIVNKYIYTKCNCSLSETVVKIKGSSSGSLYSDFINYERTSSMPFALLKSCLLARISNGNPLRVVFCKTFKRH